MDSQYKVLSHRRNSQPTSREISRLIFSWQQASNNDKSDCFLPTSELLRAANEAWPRLCKCAMPLLGSGLDFFSFLPEKIRREVLLKELLPKTTQEFLSVLEQSTVCSRANDPSLYTIFPMASTKDLWIDVQGFFCDATNLKLNALTTDHFRI